MSAQKTILVTNGVGLTASRCILLAFQRAYNVRTTIRSPRRIDELKRILLDGGATQQQILSLTILPYNELYTAEDYAEIVQGCDFIIHIIPYSAWDIRHMHQEDALSLANDPLLNLLNAAKASKPHCKVVIFNTFSAVNGNPPIAGKGQPFTEADWSTFHPYNEKDLIPGIMVRRRNVAVAAEIAEWMWYEAHEKKTFSVSVICAVHAIGPILHSSQAETQSLIKVLLSETKQEGPDYAIGVVDPRDLAELAFLVLDSESSSGERYIACADGDLVSIKEIGRTLRKATGDRGVEYNAWAPWMTKALKFTGLFGSELDELPKSNRASNQKARGLGWRPRSAEDCIAASVEALIKYGGLDDEKSKHSKDSV